MDDHDMDNVQFMLSLNMEATAVWYESLTEDDRDYAQELLFRYSELLVDAAQDLMVEHELEDMAGVYPLATFVLDNMRA